MHVDPTRVLGREAAAGVRALRAYRSPFLWPAPVLPQPEPQPGPLRTEAHAFRLAVSDTTRDPYGTPIPEQGSGDCYCRTDTEFLPNRHLSEGAWHLQALGAEFSRVFLGSFSGTHSDALAPTTGSEWPRPGRSLPRPLGRGT